MTLALITIFMCIAVFAGGFLIYISDNAGGPEPFVVGCLSLATGIGFAIKVGMLIGTTP